MCVMWLRKQQRLTMVIGGDRPRIGRVQYSVLDERVAPHRRRAPMLGLAPVASWISNAFMGQLPAHDAGESRLATAPLIRDHVSHF